MFGNKHLENIDQRISRLVDSITSLTNNVEKMGVQHENLRTDHSVLENRVTNNERDILNLRDMKSKLDLIGKTVSIGGIALVSGIMFSWNSLSTKADATASATTANSQRISVIEEQNADQSKIMTDMNAKILANREAIIARKGD